ncbi:MAG: LamG-like jellyroll fold domain-containing protein [Promethearchaeota archaeon]
MIFLNKNENEWIKIPKTQKTRKILALTLITLILISEVAKNVHADDLGLEFNANPTTADIGELITFNWTNTGDFNSGWINFGDGNITVLSDDDDNSTISHKYTTEGTYNVTLYIENDFNPKDYDTDSIIITIKNDPPQFDISLLSEAYEDDAVNVSVVNLVESEHDLQDGVLTYVYDFADGETVNTNQSSIIHEWNNAGVYKVTVTVIDDQGALDQESQNIQINNKPPDAYFTFAPTSASNNTVASYYGTYDFRSDIIGQEPENWSVYDSDDVDLETAIIRPNEDGDKKEWTPSISGNHYVLVNEETPDENEDDIIRAYYNPYDYIQTERFEMGAVDMAGGTIVKISIHAYGKFIPGDLESIQPCSRINLGGWKFRKTWNFSSTGYSWKTLTWTGLNGSQSDLNNLIIEFEAIILSIAPAEYRIDAVYCEIFYTHNIEISIMDDGGYYREVIKFYDHDTTERVWMENSFDSQTSGTIEFYLKSSDATIDTWTLILYDGSTYGLKLFMKNDQWNYINGTSGTISECGTPLDNQWYWIRLDFCTSGFYLGLNAHQFRVTVDNSSSNIYHFEDISQVNKIRFESNVSAQGTAWIDAIGYTWDENYQIGDNKNVVISYPEKTHIQFMANCTDTGNDLASMRFYWDFGDGTSGWGKYPVHSYLTSGFYIVNLTCKDDNGKTDWYTERVLIHNLYPDIVNVSCSNNFTTINEGETILFAAEPTDDESDLSRLSYWWEFEDDGFDPYNTSSYESGGWLRSHFYTDDYCGYAYIIVKDPEGALGYKAVLVNVSNVAPLLSIWDASILANISFEVYRNSPSYDANFTFELLSNDEAQLISFLNFTGSENSLVYSDKTQIPMTLSKLWRVIVNSSEVLPENSWFRYYVKLQFLSGEILVISSSKLYGGGYGSWEIDLNPHFYDNGDYTFKYPITFNAHIWDPSVDDIFLSIQYNVSMHLIIDCANTLPLEDSFTIEYPLSNVSYIINVYMEDGVKYANITASQDISLESLNDNAFPVSLDTNFTIYPIIDLFELLEIQMELTNLTIINCAQALNFLIGVAADDDGGEGTLTIIFNTDDNIEFENLSPHIEQYLPDQALEGTNVTFYVEVSDFDQISDQEDYYVANFRSSDIPTMPDDFALNNGTCDWEGELLFQDNNYATFSPENMLSTEDVWLKLDEGTGSHAEDSADGDEDGTIYGASWTTGKLGDYALDFDGSNDYIDVDYNLPNVGFTMCAWYKATTGGRRSIISEGAVGESPWTNVQHILIYSDTQIGYFTETGYGTNHEYRFTPTGNIIDGQWHFVCAIITSGNLVFYWDDQKFTSSIVNTDTTASNCWIGCYGGPSSAEFFDGIIDDVRIYESTLSDDDIEWLYNGGYGRPNDVCFEANFHLDNVDDEQILKYLKIFYAYKADLSIQVNLRLYNFTKDSWTLIDSSNVSTNIYRNKYSILSSEFINDTNDILVKIETKSKLYVDQLKIEYYSSEVSDDGSYGHEDIPIQPHEFTIYSGTCDWGGDLNSIDDSYTTIVSTEAGDPSTGIIRPNGDITTQWSMSTPHYTRLDEEIEDPTEGDSYYIYTCVPSMTEQYHFETIAGVDTITQIEVKMYGKVTQNKRPTAQIYLGEWEDAKTCSWGPDLYTWSSLIWSGLSGSQSDLDNFQIKIKSPSGYIGYLYLNTLYVIVTYQQVAGLNFTSEFHLDGVRPIDQIDSAELLYSFKTNISTDIDLSLYNYDSSSWDVVDTLIYTQFNNCSYEISGTEYLNPYYNIKVRFEGEETSKFEFYLEKLKLHYTWTKGSHEDDYVYSDYPVYPADFTLYNGTHDSEGNLELPDEDYSVYNSTVDGDLNFYAVLSLGAAQPSDLITSLWLNYSYKTNIYQLINVSLYNFTSLEWYLVASSTPTEFFNGSYSIPITRVETVNDTEIEYHDFYDANFNIFVQFDGANQSSQFQLFLDQLKVEYTVTSYIFVGDSSRIINAVQGDYVSFDSELEGDSQVVDEIFELTLDQMNYHRFGLFESCQVSYSLNTSIPQNISINIYNYTGSEWTEFDSLTTDSSTLYNRSFVFNDKDFISSVYNVSVQILGINTTGNAFTLYLYKLEVKYNWSIAHADCGVDYNSYGLQIDYNMSSRYFTIFYEDFNFNYEGIYLVIMSADDGYHTTKTGKVINITKVDPFTSIGHFTSETIEDKNVYFTSDIYVSGSNATMSDYKFFWLFGDGSFSNDANPVHAYAKSGVYNLSLTVIDCFGNSYSDVKNITVVEKAPEIVGPYTFYGIEGQAITLDVDIFDAFLDEIDLEYEWYNSSGLFSTDKKPSLLLEDGSYKYTVNVTDSLGQTATADIDVIIEDAPPVVLVSSYMYSGGNVDGSEGFFAGAADDPGELALTAYGYDTSDNNDLDYYWSITNDNTTFETYEQHADMSSTVKFRVKETAIYLGQVKIVSSEKSAVASFIINSVIDSNGNGISNEMEAMILENYDNVTAYSDYDDDGLTDIYEISHNISDYSDPDTDDDGLWDGLNNETGIGEQSLSTKPNDPDSDDDGLNDGLEFFGWNITTEFFGTITVNSDPWKIDTDGDGVSDYDEYFYGTNPRTSDTDTDGIVDSLDPYPTKYDYDGDGLSDKIELELGTALNVTDTDNDGITDAEEVLGWFKTNPLSADSDHDFASDTAEIQNYRFTIDDRYDLDEPVSLSFEKNCERAVSAQIAFMITFGEAINEGDKVYGIQNVPDLNISVIKVDDNLLLFNATTNCTRYYSKVIDFREIMENNSKDYRGEYTIKINNTEAGCILEQFEIEIAGYLDPHASDYDGDGIMDGVEMGLLVRGTDTIDHEDLYGEAVTIHFPMEETCWWSMDDGTGTTAFDLTFYENNGTLTNMESGDWKTGKIGDYALEFDGVNEFVDCGNEYYLDFERNNTFTLSVWIKTSSTGRTIISKMNTSDDYRGYDLYIDNSGVIRVHLINTLDSNEIIVDGATSINDNQWHFITLTYNGSSTASGVKLYIDGSLDNLTIVKDTLNKTIHTDVNFLIGARTEGNYFSGQIDDVRVYSFALTQDNITWLYNSGNGRPSKTLGGVDKPEVKTQYYLEIPSVGVVYDANLTLSIESYGIPIGLGNITVEIVKEELNCSIDDVVLSSAFNEFSNTTQFSYEKFIDITPYLNNNSITEFYGKYFVNIEIQGTDYRDKFLVVEFYIQTDTFIEAGSTNTEAWLTDPADKDTDGDGWNDYKEIFIEGTNPLSPDTDGDGAWDKYDRDPHKDVMLKISPISGTICYYKTRKLEIVISFKQEGTGESYSIYTLRHWTTVQGETSVPGYPLPYYEWTAYFDGTHGSPDALQYYIDIDDDILVQGNELEFKLQLWRINRHWDNKHLSGYDTYSINEVGYSEIVNITSIEEFESVQMKTEAKINVTTIGVEKANTIAIYETNGTVFNGHYQEQERMNIIQLYVNDSGDGTPFVEGPNVIVIPTSLFTETIFNAYVQNETLDATPIYSLDDEIFKFISVGRDGNTEQACDEIDFVFIRFNISSQDAMEILNLLLECLVNETTNETAIVYSYVSTKINGTLAVMMNLPISVLGFVPWFCNFENSLIGSKPETKSEAFWKGIKKLVSLAVGLIVIIGMAILELVELITDFIMEILMEWLPILEYILWLILRTIILIVIYILLALFLFTNLILFAVLASMASVIGLITEDSPEIKFMSVKFDFFEDEFYFHSWISTKYLDFLDLEIPIIITEITISDNVLLRDCSDLMFGSCEDEINYSPNPNYSSIVTSNNNPNFDLNAFAQGFLYASTLCTITITLLSGIKGASHKTVPMLISLLAALLIGFFLTYICENEKPKDEIIFSMQLGIGLAFIIAFFEMISAKHLRILSVKNAEKLDQNIPIYVDLLLLIIELFDSYALQDEDFVSISYGLSITSLILSCIGMSLASTITVGLLWGKQRIAESEAEVGYFGLEVIFLLFGIINFVPSIIEIFDN